MVAPRTFLLVLFESGRLSHHNAHFENHPWFHFVGELRTANCVTTIRVSAYDLIVPTLNEAISDPIFAIAADDFVKILSFRNK
jgi:hypothetical protein